MLKLFTLAVSVALSIIITISTKDINIAGKKEFIPSFVTAFSIIAGAVIAVFGIVLSPYKKSTWKRLENNRSLVIQDIMLFQTLFVLYVVTIILILTDLLIADGNPITSYVMQRSYIFIGSFSLLYSLYLPFKISSLIVREMDQTIKDKRSAKT